jgi:putative hydrolase of the HAD superfamily
MARGGPTPWAIFDYDDTVGGVLINGTPEPGFKAYDDCHRRFRDAMAELGFDRDWVKETQHEIDMELAKTHGFGNKARFGQSFRATYEKLSAVTGTPVDKQAATRLFDIGMSVFTDYPYVALEGALDVLDRVGQWYNVAIVTKGAHDEQMKKLAASGCGAFADEVIVCTHKDTAEWAKKVIGPLGLHHAEVAEVSWAIGNSRKSDVNPPLAFGLNGIWLRGMLGWEFERADAVAPLPGRALHEIDDIREVLDLLNVRSPSRAA